MTCLTEFFSNYPDIDDPQFLSKIVNKKEFQKSLDNRFYYQDLIGNFINANTPYTGLLVVHAMGLGKTCTAIKTIEKSKNFFKHGALILAPNEKLLTNFQNELVYKCIPGRPYLPEDASSLPPETLVRRINKSTEKYYRFETFEKFARELAKASDDEIRRVYDNKIWIMDEAHQILTTTDATQYPEFLRARMICKNSRLIMLTGTPMVDSPAELGPLLNLVLPAELQIDDLNKYTKNGRATPQLRQMLKGRVSYLVSRLPRKYIGTKLPNMPPLFLTTMKPTQMQVYLQTFRRENSAVYTEPRAAELAIFPNRKFDIRDASEFVKSVQNSMGHSYTLTTAGQEFFTTRAQVGEISCKYAALLDRLDEARNLRRNVFVYSSLVQGVGLHYLVALLRHFRFNFKFLDPTLGKSEAQRIVNAFNTEPGWQLIVGSEAVATGYSFMNVQQVEILTPHWNFKTVLQAIARGSRVDGTTIPNAVFEVALYCALPYSGEAALDESISYFMYKTAFKKELQINHLERDLQECSFDCEANFDKNYISGFDNLAECQYLPCNFKCESGKPSAQDLRTYNLFTPVDTLVDKIVDMFENEGTIFTFDQLESNKFLLFKALDKLTGRYFRGGKFPLLIKENFVTLGLDKPKIRSQFNIEEYIRREIILQVCSNKNYSQFGQLSRAEQTKIFEEFWRRPNLRGEAPVRYFGNFFDAEREIHWIDAPNLRKFENGQWLDYDNAEIRAHLSNDLQRLETNPYKVYGTFSRDINGANMIFCIRDVANISTKLHQRTSGKKCENYTEEELETLVRARNIPIEIRGRSKKQICSALLEWFQTNNLLVEDPYCGIQGRKKPKSAQELFDQQ